jgi:hypothetical protein
VADHLPTPPTLESNKFFTQKEFTTPDCIKAKEIPPGALTAGGLASIGAHQFGHCNAGGKPERRLNTALGQDVGSDGSAAFHDNKVWVRKAAD